MIIQNIKQLIADKPVFFMTIGLIVASIVSTVIILASVQVSDVTTFTRYSSFGKVHFYRGHWQYHILFGLFCLIVGAAHSALMAKLVGLKRRQTALFVGAVGVVILVITCFYALSVASLGYVD